MPKYLDRHVRPMRLTRDGVEVMVGTMSEIWSYLHHNTSYSVHHAVTEEGWKIEPVVSLPEE